MTKYKVVLDSDIERSIEADTVTLDSQWVQFHTRAQSGQPAVLCACFPAHTVAEVLEVK